MLILSLTIAAVVIARIAWICIADLRAQRQEDIDGFDTWEDDLYS